MASGDNTRVWFPEMLDELSQTWHQDLEWGEVKKICLHMGKRLTEIRNRKNIKTKLNIPCKSGCGCGGTMELSSKISIRSLLFSLKKIDVISEQKLKELDENWQSYQRRNNLNAFHEPKKQIISSSITG